MNGIESGVIDGEYIAEIVAINDGMDRKGRRLVEWRLRITTEKYGDVEVSKKHYLTSQKAVGFLKKELERIGIYAKDHTDLAQQSEKVKGLRIRVQSTTNEEGYQVYYVKGVVKPGEPTPRSTEDLGW